MAHTRPDVHQLETFARQLNTAPTSRHTELEASADTRIEPESALPAAPRRQPSWT
ncbi:hypothetical protein [Pseudomonas sp.]|uniref:hypothetical protein n=1 Tax=Pseudomonas sp. TaxID=306 RepID=UPI003264F42A